MFGKCGTLGMDPSFPTEDLAGGLWTSRNGMGRTDSEAAFQEFLKKIPSSTNLAGQGHASEQQGSNLASIPQQMAPGIAQHTRLPIQPIGAPEAKPQPATSRVPALGAHDVVEISVPEASGMPAPAFATTAGLTPLPGQADYAGQLQHINPLLNPLHAAQATAAAAGNPLVAAGMNYAELAALGTLALGQGNPYDLEKAKERRQRRMASNRESARRSRKRKQEHLNELEEQLQEAERERKEWMKKTEDLEARVKEIGDQNARLQEENDGLKRHLATLQGGSGATSDAGR